LGPMASAPAVKAGAADDTLGRFSVTVASTAPRRAPCRRT